MKPRTALRLLLFLACAASALGQEVRLDEHCTVAVLNRIARVDANGVWQIPNVPSNMGRVRVRATCVKDGVTRTGVSEWFLVPSNGTVFASDVQFTTPGPVPASLTLAASRTSLPALGESVQLTATARNADGSTADVTAAISGTTYTTSNPAVVRVSPDGLVTSTGNGMAIVGALNEGALGLLRFNVGGPLDSDGDGIPDDFERAVGLDPFNPADAAGDLDADGLTNLDEYVRGTDLTNPDTDGDEVRDGLEVQTETDPLDRRSFNLERALRRIDVSPPTIILRPNPMFGEAWQQLVVTGTMLDGFTLDLTSASRGTSYSSDNTDVAGFADVDGRVFAGIDGSCTVTVWSNSFLAVVSVSVSSFQPAPVAVLPIPGYANNVEVAGSHAFIAAGNAGLQIADVSDPAQPSLLPSLPLAGTCIDVRIRDGLAYAACGSAGLHIVDVSNPLAVSLRGSVDTPGDAQDVWLDQSLAFVADGDGGLQIVNVSAPDAPVLIGALAVGDAKGVSAQDNLVAVATTGGLVVVDAATPAVPVERGRVVLAGAAKDVVVRENLAYVTAFDGGLQIVDLGPATPSVIGSVPNAFVPRDVALTGSLALFAEQLFDNAIPVVDVSDPAAPEFRAIIDLTGLGDWAGTGIGLTQTHAFVTAESGVVADDYGTSGSTALLIAQYSNLTDTAGIAPSVRFLAPAAGRPQVRGARRRVTIEAIDDIGILEVALSVNGTPAGTRAFSPARFDIVNPAGATMTLTASALDFARTSATAELTLPLIDDPLTTVRGVVSYDDGSPAAGATVTLDERVTTSDAAGEYAFPGVPTLAATLTVSAAIVIGDDELRGATAVRPIEGGTTFAEITVRPLQLGVESSLVIQGHANGVDARGTVAGVAAGDGGLVLVDFGTPGEPREISTLPLPGIAGAVRFAGSLALVTGGSQGLHVVSVANPAAPALTATLPLPGTALRLAVAGMTAYVTAGDEGLHLVDVRTPGAPVLLGSLAFDGQWMEGIAVSGTTAIVAEHPERDQYGSTRSDVHAVDISDPTHPVLLDTISIPGEARAVAIHGSRAIVAADGLEVVDFSSPADLRLAGEWTGSPRALDVAVRGDQALAAGIGSDLAAGFDVSGVSPSPTSVPYPAGGYYGNGVALARNLALVTGYATNGVAYSGSGDTRLFVLRTDGRVDRAGAAPAVSIASPSPGATVVRGSVVTVQAAATDDQTVLSVTLLVDEMPVATLFEAAPTFSFRAPATGDEVSLRAVAQDFGDNIGSSATVVLNLIPDPNTTIAGTVRDEVGTAVAGAVVSYRAQRTRTDPSGRYSFADQPTVHGNVVTEAAARIGLRQAGSSIARPPVPGGTTTADITLHVLPDGPAGAIDIPGYANSVVVRGDVAMVAAGAAGLQLVDIEIPTRPRQLAAVALDDVFDVDTAGPFAYALSTSGLTVIDVTDPVSPEIRGSVSFSGGAQSIVVRDGRAYIANRWLGLQIADVSDPAAPAMLGELPMAESPVDVALWDHYAIVIDVGRYGYENRLSVIDVADPWAPALVGEIILNGTARAVAVHDGHAFVATGGTVEAVSLANPALPELAGSFTDDYAWQIAVDSEGTGIIGRYGGSERDRCLLLDLTEPASPVTIGTVLLGSGPPFTPTGFAPSGELLLATGDAAFSPPEVGQQGTTRLFLTKYRATLPAVRAQDRR